jgi:RsiW-degrading membrane proteinase PrsW (M82 family)
MRREKLVSMKDREQQVDVCVICHQPLGSSGQRIRGHGYCPVHFAKISRPRAGVWWAGLAQLAALILLVLVLELLLAWIPLQLEGGWLILAGIILAGIPALLWLAFFYAQDRLEPEPKGYVLGVFALGALLAAAVGVPLLRDLFRTADWLGSSPWINLAGCILVVGASQEFLKYAAVRYSVYNLAEFDERTDGIIYGTAAGLGFATVLNLNAILGSGGINLEAVVIMVVVTALAQACFAGISGYFLGRSKFEHRPWWWLPSGIGIAAVGNGLFTFAGN